MKRDFTFILGVTLMALSANASDDNMRQQVATPNRIKDIFNGQSLQPCLAPHTPSKWVNVLDRALETGCITQIEYDWSLNKRIAPICNEGELMLACWF